MKNRKVTGPDTMNIELIIYCELLLELRMLERGKSTTI